MSTPRAALLAWYDANARDLPWRRTRDPYAIWVSEVMLQQTRVDTVIPYYARFLERFPTMHALATASEDDVLAMWSGLGYYRRARLLHQGVAEAVATYGEVPVDADARRSLPGIGAYTAGAIGSIAFDRPEPIVDGNVARVLARVHGVETPLGRRDTTKSLWSLASEWAAGERPGALNQALMELGATVCTPTGARCDRCPIVDSCKVRGEGRVDELPVSAAKKAPTPVSWSAAIVRSPSGRIAFVRGDKKLFGGLWGVPMVEAAIETLRDAALALGLDATIAAEPLGETRHVLSHRILTVTMYGGEVESESEGVRWVVPDALGELGVSTLTKKLLAASTRAKPSNVGTRARKSRAAKP